MAPQELGPSLQTGVPDDGAMVIRESAMKFDVSETGFVIDAEEVAPLLDIAPEEMRRLMRLGKITSLSEIGEGDDAGRHRITLRHGPIRVRWTVDGQGRVLSQSRVVARLPPAKA